MVKYRYIIKEKVRDMPRPVKKRRICKEPEVSHFGPYVHRHMQLEKIEMTLEEFETIRLMDYEGLDQTGTAARMNVGRSTVQRIYESARNKMATSLIEQKRLTIGGGNYEVCGHRNRRRCSETCWQDAKDGDK